MLDWLKLDAWKKFQKKKSPLNGGVWWWFPSHGIQSVKKNHPNKNKNPSYQPQMAEKVQVEWFYCVRFYQVNTHWNQQRLPNFCPENTLLGTITYPIPKHFWRWFFLFPRWDMLVPWKVSLLMPGKEIFIILQSYLIFRGEKLAVSCSKRYLESLARWTSIHLHICTWNFWNQTRQYVKHTLKTMAALSSPGLKVKLLVGY